MIDRVLLLFASLLLSVAQAKIIQYDQHHIAAERPEYLVIPKFDRSEVPDWSPGRGRSYIDLSHLKLQSTCDPSADKSKCKATTFDLLIFKASTDNPDKSWKDLWRNDDFCCSQAMVDQGECLPTQLNRLIVPASLPSEILPRSTVVPANEEVYLVEEDQVARYNVRKSGVYVIVMAVCDPNAPQITIEGSIDSLDPYGYVPADLFGNLPFYLTLTCLYMIIALVWSILCSMYWNQLIPLQYWISAVLVIALIETTMLFSHFLEWNDHGIPATSITVVGLVFGVIKRALSRVLVQLVALGYGVVRSTLGEDMNRVLYLGSAYFVLSLIYTLMVNLSSSAKQLGETQYDFVTMLVFLMAVIDTTFYVWIFTSINNLMISLASRKQGVKFLLYRNFRSVLFAMLGFTVVWAIYGSVFFMNDSNAANPYWRGRWSVDALWELIYFFVFVAVAVLWAPSKNSQRYAHSVELTQLDDDAEFNEVANAVARAEESDGELDDEYGGKLKDENDPFQGKGALDPAMAILKKA